MASLPRVSPSSESGPTNQTNPNSQNDKNSNVEKTSPFKEFSRQVSQTISDNVAPMNVVRQGAYNAFGNNILTRTALGTADAGISALEKWITGQDDEEEEKSVKELKEIKKSIDTMVISMDKLVNGLTGNDKSGGTSEQKDPIDFTELKEILKDVMTEVVTTKYPYIIDQIESDLTDIKKVLENGFETLGDKIDHGVSTLGEKIDHGTSTIGEKLDKMTSDMEKYDANNQTRHEHQQKREKFMGDVEIVDPLKRQLTTIIKKLTYREKFEKIVVKALIECKKVLDGISKSNRGILKAITDQCKPVEDPNASEKEIEGKNEKFMGMVEEVPKKSSGTDLQTIGAAVGGASIIDNIVDVATNFGDEIVSGLKKAGSKIGEMTTKGLEWVGEKFGSLKEGAKKIIGSISETAGELASGAKSKLGSIAETAGELASGAKSKLGGIAETAMKGIGESGLLKTGGKLLGRVAGTAILPALTAYDAYEGAKDENARDILGIKDDRELTSGEKTQAGVSNAISGLTFGLLDKKKVAGWLQDASNATSDAMSKMFDPNDLKEPAQKAIPAAPAAGSASVSVNTNNNTYVGSRKQAKNDDSSYNRYLDKHYAF